MCPQVHNTLPRIWSSAFFEARSNAFPLPADSSARQGGWDRFRISYQGPSLECFWAQVGVALSLHHAPPRRSAKR